MVWGVFPRVDPSPAILRLADTQAGVLSHGQLAQIGLPPGSGQRWKKGWLAMGPELYCLREPSWESWCWAGILHAGRTGVVGGLAAAHLQGLIPDPPDDITVWHERSSALRRIGDSERSVSFRRSSRRGMGGLPRTIVEDTVLDAAKEADEDETVALVARALAQRLTTPPRLLTQMEQRQRVAHRGVLTELCGEAAAGVESVL